jgi:hypothetical protein
VDSKSGDYEEEVPDFGTPDFGYGSNYAYPS